jgi:lipoprotein releasing system LolC/E family transmembrane protein
MRFPLFIAKRYLIAKKSHNLINLITLISMAGIAVGTMALVIVLSVFNGFEGLVTGMFNAFNPDLRITALKGKSFHIADLSPDKIGKIPGVAYVSAVVEENALARFGEKQYLVTLKGVEPDFRHMVPLDSFMIEGSYAPSGGRTAVIGAGVAYSLGIYPKDFKLPMSLYVPQRTRKTITAESFNVRNVSVAGVFSVQQDFDLQYVIMDISVARELLEYTDEATALEIGLTPGADAEIVRNAVRSLAGPSFEVKDRFQQQAMLYKIMKSEKWAVFLILSFILVIAAFNMIGSLSMLIIDKKKDIAVLWSLGADKRTIRRIFYSEGMMLSLAGGLAGLVLGTLVALLQQESGIIRLGGGEGAYIVDAYPVKIYFLDLLYVFLTVMAIGAATTWFPVRQISRRYLSRRLTFFLTR